MPQRLADLGRSTGGNGSHADPTPHCAERIPLSLPRLPDSLLGRTVLHLSDLHIRRFRPGLQRLVEQVSRERPDLVFMTGDYMTRPGDEKQALRAMGHLVEALQPRLERGIFASFGNHDYAAFRRLAPQWMPQVHWLVDDARAIESLGVTVIGVSTPCDVLAGVRAAEAVEQGRTHYRIVIGHEPSIIITTARFGIEWCLAGHTHGGQIRIGTRIALHTSCDLPARFASGILRLHDSVCTVSRGLGESYFDVRAFCDVQLPMYVLTRGPMLGDRCDRLTCVKWW